MSFDMIEDLLNRAHDHMVEAVSLMRDNDSFFSGSATWQRIYWRRGQAYDIMSHMIRVGRGLIYLHKLHSGEGRFTKEQCFLIEDIARMALATCDTRGGHYDFWAQLFAAAKSEQRVMKYDEGTNYV